MTGLSENFLSINHCIDAEKRKVRYQWVIFIYSQHKALKGEITDMKKKKRDSF